MNYMEIRKCDSGNGIGCRVSLFVSGCDIRCPNCFNKESWDFNAGKEFTRDTIDEIIEYMKPDYITGLSILGGDTISNVKRETWLTELVIAVKRAYPEKTIFVWTGYKYEDIIKNCCVKTFLKYIDMLRDGPYIEEEKNLNQYLQGSNNQRYIDVQESLKQNKVIDNYFGL